MPKALVIGGGVAGPAVAQLLARAGWDAPVFEAQPEPDAFAGLFLNVAVNGQRVLGALGVAGASTWWWSPTDLPDARPRQAWSCGEGGCTG